MASTSYTTEAGLIYHAIHTTTANWQEQVTKQKKVMHALAAYDFVTSQLILPIW